MKYVLLIYQYTENDPDNPPAPEDIEDCFTSAKAAERDGVLLAAEPLQKSSRTTVVRVRDGATLTTDGPFLESKEQLSGFYLVDCETLDQAVRCAERIPGASEGAVEVRPVMQFDVPDWFLEPVQQPATLEVS